MITVTIGELRERVRVYTDTVNALTPSDSTIEGGINASCRALYARICEGGAEFLTTSTILATAADVGTYELPANFWKLRSVVWRRGPRDSLQLFRFEQRDRADLENLAWGPWARYRLSDAAFSGGPPAIEFVPPPDGVHTIFVAYVPDPPTLGGQAETPLVCTPGMDEWIVLDVTCRILMAEETDVSTWAQMREDVWQREVVPSLGGRDEYRSAAISDRDQDCV